MKYKLSLIFVCAGVAGCVSGAVAAPQADQIASAALCSAIPDSLARLTCFDRVFPKGSPTAAVDKPNPTPSPNAWDIKREKSAIDDSPTVVASLTPTETSGSGIGNSEMWLLARCSENITSVVLATNMFMTDSPKVTIRIGESPAKTTVWVRSTNYKSAGLWNGSEAIPFLKSLKNGVKLVVRVEEKDRLDGTFNLGNVEDVTAEIAAACKWK
ncbi:type VI secretion protein [Mesorhizobium qingshengii]|uniref:Type VI secretion protein n=1 Tax=Mesorhizobium qingshengii TaxID=1165689 RepID=A0ABT4R1C0_9HYPH|nr:type VI secretion system-associated protein TagO [Mesorhizobium qingshengii]MCZ8547649.1 type VI secretion protein [Mesorhizobium qingshengii]